jgi:hypothetical protein
MVAAQPRPFYLMDHSSYACEGDPSGVSDHWLPLGRSPLHLEITDLCLLA